MNESNNKEKDMLLTVGKCAMIGGGAVASIAGIMSAPITLTAVLIGGAAGCALGAIFLSKKTVK